MEHLPTRSLKSGFEAAVNALLRLIEDPNTDVETKKKASEAFRALMDGRRQMH